MNRRQEPCRNFLRGSCKYGAQCKFAHVSQQQSRPNVFGFGSQGTSPFAQTSQQQKPNPFGFGVQNNSQLKGESNYGSKYQSPAKPFENKWTRSSSLASANATSSKQTDAQLQAAVHTCTDPESCKRQIAEDYKNEAPLWKLTCYGHRKSGPCDIVGDVSFEELRALAYEDARKGLSFQSIVERERNLLNSKLVEFDNLLRNPSVSQSSKLPVTSLFPGAKSTTSIGGSQSSTPPSFSSFSQIAAATNLGSGLRTPAQGTPDTTFGQPSFFQKTSQTPGGSEMKFGTPGTFGQPMPNQPSGGLPGYNFNNSAKATGNDQLPFSLSPTQFNQSSSFLDKPIVSSTVHQAFSGEQQEEGQDDSIWLKEEWAIGEIPEREPPMRYC
ncbi:zinc finger CCCH domain-containing protein 46 [Typha angustifolia]|uniref:zinc finger CCCH domain-containing protein 46 n=1 Tax=Typha angustifolia TaxID=59011 RepID=UPI003C2BCF1B